MKYYSLLFIGNKVVYKKEFSFRHGLLCLMIIPIYCFMNLEVKDPLLVSTEMMYIPG